LQGPLRDAADGSGEGGGDQKTEPLTAADVAKIAADAVAKAQAEWQKQLDAKEKAAETKRKADEQKAAAEAESQRKKDEEERQRKEEEQRAAAGGADQQTKYELTKLQRLLAEEQKKREASEEKTRQKEAEMAEKDRVQAIRTALSGYQFGKNGAEIAFRHVQSDIKRNDEGVLVGPGGAPLQDYLNDQFRTGGELEGLLAPRSSGGSGATGGQGAAGNGAIDIESIKPGANNEAARAEIARMASDMMRGRR
jgi:hypothetical protein